MKKKKIIISSLSIALIGACAISYVLINLPHYKKAYNICVSSNVNDLGGEAEEYKTYCKCFVTAPEKVMPQDAYQKWLDLYVKDKAAARDMMLEKEYNFQPQFECLIENAPLRLWIELLKKIYVDVEGLSETDAKCVLEEHAKLLNGEKAFIKFTKIKMKLLEISEENMETFELAEEKIKNSCILCRHISNVLTDVKDIDKAIINPVTNKPEPIIITAVRNECELDNILKLHPKLNFAVKDSKSGWLISPLMWAALLNSEKMMRMLIENGAKIDYQETETGYTALMYAAQLNKKNAARFLLENGADYKLEAKDGALALMLAMQEDNEEIVDMLMERGATMNLKLIDPAGYDFLTVLSDRASPRMVQLALNMGANVNEQNAANKRTALMIAAMSDRIDVMKVLLENGADPNIVDKNLFSPLMVASLHNNYDIVKLLLDYGAKVDLKNTIGTTALNLAKNLDEDKRNEDTEKIIELLGKK